MITGLDDASALDPKRVGAKAAALALARQGGLPVLPGFVVETSVSRRHMEVGALALEGRGSGGARLTVTSLPIPEGPRIAALGAELSPTLTVRSSSPLETDAIWAGAFTSYLGIPPEDLPKAVAGCWASAFSVDALDRQDHAGIEPGSVPMAVLVQPFVETRAAGVAEIHPDGTLRVEAVAGSPAPLLQGWERGVTAARRPGHGWEGAGAIGLIGEQTLDELGAALDAALQRYGFDRCEWGVAGSLWILQLGNVDRPVSTNPPARVTTPSELIPLVQALFASPADSDGSAARARGGGGGGVSYPTAAAVVLDHGVRTQGVPAAPGVGIGPLHHFARADGRAPPPRAVITASSASPDLSQLIWDAAGLVTDLGSPAAHVFETARSLRVPAVCGVDLGPNEDQIVAVDGYSGVVAVLPVRGQASP